jgi:rare lipoprotein A
MDDESSYRERGEASWYGKKFHGRRTSNGEIYDMYAMTAAHKTLPIPSYVRVTHVGNGRSVIVRVNDRGPFHGSRIIDLSYAAAQRLGFAERGVALVDVEIVVPDDVAPPPLRASATRGQGEQSLPGNTYLQVGAFGAESSARTLAERVARETGRAVMVSRLNGPTSVYRVRVGPLSDTGQLHQAREQMQVLGLTETHLVYE